MVASVITSFMKMAAPEESSSNSQKQCGTKKIFDKLMFLSGIITFVIIGATARGEWILLLVHYFKQQDIKLGEEQTSLGLPVFHDVLWWVAVAIGGSFIPFYGLAGFLHYHYYIKQRSRPEDWKCQPERFLSPENARHAILMGSFNMLLGGTISGVLACWIMNGGYSTLYFHISDYSWTHLILTPILVFILTEAGVYYLHRAMHLPVLYKMFHKHHHRYHSPTAFTLVATHPVELIAHSLVTIPIFIIPMYSGFYILLVLYKYYYGLMHHSGIKMEALWPWQPNTMFHDDHHKYCHVNFGLNMALWDWIHGTAKINNRIYEEDIFYGKGKPKSN